MRDPHRRGPRFRRRAGHRALPRHRPAAKLRALGVNTGADLAGADPALLEARFGKTGRWFASVARGEDDRAVQPDRARKSSGSETTFARDLTDAAEIEAGVAAMADDVWDWAERTGTSGRTVTVKAKFADFQIVTRSRSLGAPVPGRAVLHAVARALVRTLHPLRVGLRLVGVTLSNLGPLVPAPDNPDEPLLPI